MPHSCSPVKEPSAAPSWRLRPPYEAPTRPLRGPYEAPTRPLRAPSKFRARCPRLPGPQMLRHGLLLFPYTMVQLYQIPHHLASTFEPRGSDDTWTKVEGQARRTQADPGGTRELDCQRCSVYLEARIWQAVGCHQYHAQRPGPGPPDQCRLSAGALRRRHASSPRHTSSGPDASAQASSRQDQWPHASSGDCRRRTAARAHVSALRDEHAALRRGGQAHLRWLPPHHRAEET